MNNRNIKLFIASFFILIFMFYIFSAENEEVTFRWAIIQKKNKGKIFNLDFNKKVKMKSEDIFKIYIKPIQNAYIYIFTYDAQEKLLLHFPSAIDIFDNQKNYNMNVEYLIPPDADGWIGLDDKKGTEKIILIASKIRLAELENLTKKYIALLSINSVDEIQNAKKSILDEINKLKLENQNASVIAEKQIPFLLDYPDMDVKNTKLYAVQVTVKNFYERTFNIEHE